MFIRVLLPEPQRIVSGVFDCSRNVLVQIGIHETLTEAENGFRLLEGIPADSPTVVGHWPFTTLAGSGGQDLDTLNHFDHCCEVIDGQVRLVSGISASDINHWPGDYQVSVPGTLALAFRDYYGSEIDEELQIAFVVLTPSFAAITVYDRRKLSYYSWEDCGDSLESLQEAIEFLFRGDWRHNLQRIVVVGWHPAATGIKWDLVQSGAVRSEFDGKRAFGEDVQFRELNGCTNQIGSPFHHSAYPALLFAAGRLAALGFGPDFGGKLASQPPAQKPKLRDRFHQGLLNGVVARVGRGGVSAGLGIGLMLLLLLLPVEYYWYTSEKNTLTQANQHEDENLVKNEDVANKV
ncbi:MAG: hypothetical protein K1Y36_30970, partial [Blastocatellia bacterium]|nr:hypothetical protein [Blastocatellia bacterium]